MFSVFGLIEFRGVFWGETASQRLGGLRESQRLLAVMGNNCTKISESCQLGIDFHMRLS